MSTLLSFFGTLCQATRFSIRESQSHDANLEFLYSSIPYLMTVNHMSPNHLAQMLWEL